MLVQQARVKAQQADDAYHAELVRVYGASKAGDARYKYQHEDAAVQAAGDAYHDAADALHNAVLELRRAAL
jgi:hypothetical protein